MHPECATSWQNNRNIIQSSTDNKLQQQMESHYNNVNKKLDCLTAKQRKKNKTRHNNQEQQFYPKTKHLTNIKFNKDGMDLLNHGLQHSKETPLKTYWTDLIVETERVVKLYYK
jgi:hypothetical protein